MNSYSASGGLSHPGMRRDASLNPRPLKQSDGLERKSMSLFKDTVTETEALRTHLESTSIKNKLHHLNALVIL